MRQFAENLDKPGRHGRAAHAYEDAGIGGPHHQVRADAVGALLGVVQHPHEDAHDGQDHNDFNSHGQHADDGADRAAQQIGKDKLIHSRRRLRKAANRWNSLISE